MRSWDINEGINRMMSKEKKEAFMDALHQQMLDTLPDERIPLLEFVLGAVSSKTPVALYESPAHMSALLSETVNMAPDSLEKKMLQAYLKSCAPHERPPVLAYFLAHQGEAGGGGVRSLFEAFSTVGIKTGQLASILDTFGNPEVREDLASLKDGAKPLEKVEILEILEKALGSEKFGQIQGVHRLLGSASIKTVVDVEWANGEHSAVMIRRPHAKELVQEHLSRTARFMEELNQDADLKKHAASLDPLRKIVAEELKEEVEFEKELEHTHKAGQVYGISADPKMTESGWKIQVPQVHSDLSQVYRVSEHNESAPTVMVMEMAHGVGFNRVSDPQLKKEAGSLIARASIDQLFSKGFMNADPHQGNFLVNEQTKTIYPIDFGQAESLHLPDEVIRLSHFLASLAHRNISRVIEYGSQFCEPVPSRAVLDEIEKHLKKNGKEWSIPEVINAFHESGAELSRRFFGILKGLAVLQKEEYVPEKEFEHLLAEQVEQTIRSSGAAKARYLLDELQCKAAEKVNSVLNRIKTGSWLPSSSKCGNE